MSAICAIRPADQVSAIRYDLADRWVSAGESSKPKFTIPLAEWVGSGRGGVTVLHDEALTAPYWAGLVWTRKKRRGPRKGTCWLIQRPSPSTLPGSDHESAASDAEV